MALFAETLVEEWLNRRGYFTVRGAKAGLLEMDLLAIQHGGSGHPKALHVEVQVSTGPISWITKWPPPLQRELGIAPNNARGRTDEQLSQCVEAWVGKKFRDPRVMSIRERLWPGAQWKFLLVHGAVRHPQELPTIANHGIEVVEITNVIDDLVKGSGEWLKTTSSTAADIAALVGFDRKTRPPV